MNINKIILACYVLTHISATQAMLIPQDAAQQTKQYTKQLAKKESTDAKDQLDVAIALKPTKEKITKLKHSNAIVIPLQQSKNRNPQLFKVKDQDPELCNDIHNSIKVATGLTIGSTLVIPPATHLFLIFSCACMNYCPDLSSVPFLAADKTAAIAFLFWMFMTPVFMKKKGNPLKKFYKNT